jgi:hypothetical protein
MNRRLVLPCSVLLCTLFSDRVCGQNAPPQEPIPGEPAVLSRDSFQHYSAEFTRNDPELYPQYIRNSGAWGFLSTNVPLLECPDKEIEEIYYFRWWTFRKHIKSTPDGFVITEFLPSVGWAGKHNSICCAAGHHFREGRWLRDTRYLDDYAMFWFRKGGSIRAYSFWAADSMLARSKVTGDERLSKLLLADLVANFEAWEKERRDPNGLFWQVDGQDGMEVSISGALHPRGEGYRATINSYLYGDAMAIAEIARRSGQSELAEKYQAKAEAIRNLVIEKLWDPDAGFFKVIPRSEPLRFSDARELHGYTPWYFDLPDSTKSSAWRQLMDTNGFLAPFGPTTAERRHPKFSISYEGHECQWNGPSWPYSTAITLTALANLLNDYDQQVMTAMDYYRLLKIYTASHKLKLDDGQTIPWIDENLNPLTGDWISRTRLKTWNNGTWDTGKGGVERGRDYNHSTYCDLIITGLIGLRPRLDNIVDVHPLIPSDWAYFCLDQVPYHGRMLTILWDKTGDHYGKGKGLRILSDGKEIAAVARCERLQGKLR